MAKRQPFEAFDIVVADGRRLPVAHPDFIAFPPRRGRSILLYLPDGKFEIIDLRQITTLSAAGGFAPDSPPRESDDFESDAE